MKATKRVIENLKKHSIVHLLAMLAAKHIFKIFTTLYHKEYVLQDVQNVNLGIDMMLLAEIYDNIASWGLTKIASWGLIVVSNWGSDDVAN